jgi:hypothetical protein
VCISHGLSSRGAILQLTTSAKGSDDHVPVIVAAFGSTLSLLGISAPSCLLMRINGFVPQPDAGQLISRGQPNQSGCVGKRISLAFVEVTRQRLNSYRLTH